MDAEELLDLGLTWQLKGDLIKAEDYLKKALVKKPQLKGAHLGLGDICLKQDKLDMAQKMYMKEIEINPASVKAHIELANVCILKGEEDEALSNFEKALSLSPNDWRGSKGMGYIYFLKSELEKAVGWLTMAAENNENDFSIHFLLALIYHRKGFTKEMDIEIERIRTVCQNIEKFTAKQGLVIAYVLGKVYALQGRYKDAIKHLEDLRKRIKFKNRKRLELGLFYDELDILKTLADVYDRTGDKNSSNAIQKEINALTSAKPL